MDFNQRQKLLGLPENENADLQYLMAAPEDQEAIMPGRTTQEAKNAMAAPVAAPQQSFKPSFDTPNAPKEETQVEKLERMAQEMSTQRQRDMEDANKKQLYRDLISGLNSNLGLIVGGAQAMNTGASVQPPKQADIADIDLADKVDKRYKIDQEALMDKYKALLKAQEDAKTSAQRKEDRDDIIAERRADRQARLNMFQRGQDYREEKGDRLSDKQTGEVESLDNALNMVNTIEIEKPKFNTGPIKSRIQGVLSTVGAEDPEYAAFKARTIDTLSDYVKSKSGLQVTDAERRALAEVVPNTSMDDDTFNSTLKVFKERLNNVRSQKVDIFGKQGKSVGNFEQRSQAPTPPETKTVNGSTYRKVPGGWEKVK